MKNYIILLYIFVLFTSAAFAQESYEIRQAIDLFQTTKKMSGDRENRLTESQIEGSPYLNNEFVKGIVYTKTKQQYVDILLRYNIYNDQVEFQTEENKIQAIDPPEIIEKIEMGKYEIYYLPYSFGKKIKKGFFTLLSRGNASLYLRLEVEFSEAEEPAPYKEAKPAEFIRKPDSYYIRIEPAQAIKIGNKKDFPKLFPNHQTEISNFIKKNKTKTNNIDNLKQLVEYYNSL